MIRSTLKKRRRGFTLIEVLVVISIIGILLSLVLSGAFKARESQEKQVTSNNMQKIASGLDQQLKAIIDGASESFTAKGTAVGEIIKLAGNDTRRAKAMWIKVQLRRELPQTPAELNNTLLGVAPVPTAFNQLIGQSFNNSTSKFNNCSSDDIASAAALFVTVTSARRGVTFEAEKALGTTGVTSVTSDNNRTFKIFIDAWGTPIKLARVVADPLVQSELDQAKYAGKTNGTTIKSVDPTDREGTLSGNWNPVAGTLSLQNLWNYLYNSNSYTVHNYQPTIVSAGADQVFGTEDDIYSFRLREAGQRGD